MNIWLILASAASFTLFVVLYFKSKQFRLSLLLAGSFWVITAPIALWGCP